MSDILYRTCTLTNDIAIPFTQFVLESLNWCRLLCSKHISLWHFLCSSSGYNNVTCISVAREQLGKEVPVKRNS
jgi:hypothetical protein